MEEITVIESRLSHRTEEESREHKHFTEYPLVFLLYATVTLRAAIRELCVVYYVQNVHKRTLHFLNEAENNCSVIRTSHLRQSIVKLSKFCFT